MSVNYINVKSQVTPFLFEVWQSFMKQFWLCTLVMPPVQTERGCLGGLP